MWREGLFLYTATERRLPPLHTKKNNINKKSASSIQKSLKSCKLLFTLYIPAPARSGPSWHVWRLRLILHHKATQGWGVPPTPALPPPPRHPREEPGVPSSCSVRNSDACASLPVPAAGVGTDPKHALAGNPILCFPSLSLSLNLCQGDPKMLRPFPDPFPTRTQPPPSWTFTPAHRSRQGGKGTVQPSQCFSSDPLGSARWFLHQTLALDDVIVTFQGRELLFSQGFLDFELLYLEL